MNRILATLFSLVIVAGAFAPAGAAQLGAGLRFLHSVDDFENVEDVSKDDFSVFGTLTFPIALLKVEGNVEWIPDYLGSDRDLINPAAYGLLPIGPIYGGVGIGVGYLTGDGGGWASNPFYALRAGIEFGLGGLALDAFGSYQFQSASFLDGASNADLDAVTLALQIKFGG